MNAASSFAYQRITDSLPNSCTEATDERGEASNFPPSSFRAKSSQEWSRYWFFARRRTLPGSDPVCVTTGSEEVTRPLSTRSVFVSVYTGRPREVPRRRSFKVASWGMSVVPLLGQTIFPASSEASSQRLVETAQEAVFKFVGTKPFSSSYERITPRLSKSVPQRWVASVRNEETISNVPESMSR